MKKIYKIIAVLIILVVIALEALQWTLQSRLTPLVQKMLPDISREMGLNVRVERVSVNLFSGKIRISRLMALLPAATPANPPFLSIERASASLGWMSLFQKVIFVRSLSLHNACITIVRQPDGRIFLPDNDLRLGAKPSTAATHVPPSTMQGDDSPSIISPATPLSSLPKIALGKANFSAAVIFEDQIHGTDHPSRVKLDVTLIAEDLFTYGDLPPEEWGVLKLQSSSPSHPGAFAADIDVRLAPLSDPATASFTATGQILNVNLRELEGLADILNMTSDSSDIALLLNVREGVFQKGSCITTTVHNAELIGALREKYKRISLPKLITLIIPIRGTLEAPELNVPQAITQSLLKNIADNPDDMLDQFTIDGKSLRSRLKKLK